MTAPRPLPDRLALAAHHRVLVRGPDSRQVGLDPRRGRVLEDLSPGTAAMLDALGPASAGSADLLERASARGADPADAAHLLRVLLAAGLVVDAGVAARVRRRRSDAGVAVRGDGPLALGVATGLARAGVGAVHVRAAGRIASPDLVVAGTRPEDLGRDRSVVAAELLARVAPGVRTDAPGRTPPDLVVLADAQARSPAETDALTGRATEHLAVRLRDGRGVVGPLVLPGRSACLRCLDLHRTALDPSWPALAAVLVDGPGTAGPAVVAATAALATAQALLALDGPTAGAPAPPSLDATLELDLDAGTVVTRHWAPHPGCPCGAAGAPCRPPGCRETITG